MGEMKDGDQGKRLLGLMMGSILNDVKKHQVKNNLLTNPTNNTFLISGKQDVGSLPSVLELDINIPDDDSLSDDDDEISIHSETKSEEG